MNELFKFYEGLFSGESWKEIESEFQANSFDGRETRDGQTVETQFYMTGNGEPLTYGQFELLYFKKQARIFFTDVNNYLKTVSSREELKSSSVQLEFLLDFYLGKLKETYDPDRNSLVRFYEQAKTDIKKTLDFMMKNDHFPNQDSMMTSEKKTEAATVPTRPKIKWLANTNVLITLFYDLLNGQGRTEPLIEADKNFLKEFLLANFLDSDGHTLSESTIDTLFTPSKADKRSKIGDRIEIENVKLKKQVH